MNTRAVVAAIFLASTAACADRDAAGYGSAGTVVKGGDERTGAYDPVPDFWKPAPDHTEEWTWGEVSGVAVDTPDRTGNLVLLSIEYPYSGPDRPRGLDWVRYFGTMRRAILDTPPAVLLAAQYLYTRRDVDPERVTVIGVSLGVPFSVAAAATDKRIAGAALLHGGGDIATMAYYAFADRGPPWIMRALAWGLSWVAAPLEPTRYAPDVAPRPVLMVNAADDEFIPRSSVLELYVALRQPKRMVWLESAHIASGDEEVVDGLMAITLEWMTERGLR